MSSDIPPGDPRVLLAIERTFLAWTRTALALMGFGFVIARIGVFLFELTEVQPSGPGPARDAGAVRSLLLGGGLLLTGVLLQFLAVLEYRQRVASYSSGSAIPPHRWWLPQVLTGAIIMVGVGAILYLMTFAD